MGDGRGRETGGGLGGVGLGRPTQATVAGDPGTLVYTQAMLWLGGREAMTRRRRLQSIEMHAQLVVRTLLLLRRVSSRSVNKYRVPLLPRRQHKQIKHSPKCGADIPSSVPILVFNSTLHLWATLLSLDFAFSLRNQQTHTTSLITLRLWRGILFLCAFKATHGLQPANLQHDGQLQECHDQPSVGRHQERESAPTLLLALILVKQ